MPAELTDGDSKIPDRSANITYRHYVGEEDLPIVMQLVDNELSEPYSIFTYRFFVQKWPQLCWLAYDGEKCFGVVICKLEMHGDLLRGYVGMLVVLKEYRGLGVGSELVRKCIQQMQEDRADEVILECEVTNKGALALYQNLGFIRDKRLVRYYLSGNDAFRLKLLLPLHPDRLKEMQAQEAKQMALQISQTLKPQADPMAKAVPENVSERNEEASINADPSRNDLPQNNLDTGLNNLAVSYSVEQNAPSEPSEKIQAKGLGNGLDRSKKSGKKRTKKK